ncbi:MAG: MFS transporter [Planctomycetota bacterium]|jgi:DHA1 family multidrug resistance protein-like MFS transporter
MPDGQRGWKRTLGALWLAQVASLAGFSFAFPFFPFYLRELGVTDDALVSIWVGVLISASAVTMALAAPLWGVLADKYGRKIMVERSMFGASICLVLMSLAQDPWQLLAIRILQGGLSGTIAASITLVATVTPEKRAGFSLGLLQTATFVGLSMGPFVGGFTAELVGYRMCFTIAAAMLGLGGIFVVFLAREESPKRAGKEATPGEPPSPGLRGVLATGGFLTLLFVVVVTYMAQRALGPIFPLYVEDLLETGAKARAPSITGSFLGLGGLAAALTAVVVGWFSDRIKPAKILGGVTLLGGVCLAGHVLARSFLPLAFLRFGVGTAMGGSGPSLNALVHRLIPRESHGRAYGLTQSATSVGFALGPSTGGLLGAWLGFRLPFLILGCAQFLIGLFLILVVSKALGRANVPTNLKS